MNAVYRQVISYGFLFLITTAWTPLQAAEFCNDQYYIDTTLSNGARWDMCWEHRNREGIMLHQIHYTPLNGQRRKVLHQASIAQIHVPYDDNGARYHDVSDYGLGGGYLHDLPAADCPSGQLLDYGSKSVICQQTLDQGLAYKFNNDSTQSEALSLFSVSHVGAYNYIPQWKFHDNGMIEPWMGATGALQRYGTNTNHGWLTESNRVGISHLHNFFWKLDFDLGNNGTDDFVEEINFDLVSGKRVRSMTRFNQEAARSVNPVEMRSWRVVDGTNNSNGHAQSYEILLTDSGHKDVGPSSEPFTYNDFYLTRQNSCEIYASHNPTTNGCGRNLDEFVNGESVTGQDTVVWAGVTFYHVPRAEDAPLMDAHWNHFQIIPRDWHPENPVSGGGPINTTPTITSPGNQSTEINNSVNLPVTASDADGDTLTYSASGLPAGLSINTTSGVLSGTVTTAGNYNVSVTVSDGQDSASTNFNWVVTEPANTAPSANNQSVSTLENSAVSIILTGSDPEGDSLTFILVTQPANGNLTGSVPNLTYTPNNGYSGTDNFTFRVNDAALDSNTASVSITITTNPVVTLDTVITSPEPNATLTVPVSISGTATAPSGIDTVLVGIRDQVTNLWWNNGSWGTWVLNPAIVTLDSNSTGANWTTSFDPTGTPGSGRYRVFARTRDVNGTLAQAAARNFDATGPIDPGVELAAVITSPQANATLPIPITISGTATAPTGVNTVLVGIRDQINNLWWNNGSWGAWVLNPASVTASSSTAANWTVSFNPTATGGSGRYRVFVKTRENNGSLSPAEAVNFNASEGIDPGITLDTVITSPLPNTAVAAPVTITGTATAPVGVDTVLVGIRDQVTNLWWNNGSWGAWVLSPATSVTPATGSSVNWSSSFDPTGNTGSGNYRIFARTRDVNGALANAATVNFYVE